MSAHYGEGVSSLSEQFLPGAWLETAGQHLWTQTVSDVHGCMARDRAMIAEGLGRVSIIQSVALVYGMGSIF